MATVYILRSGNANLYKIGSTRGDLSKRVLALNIGNPDELSVIDTIETDEPSVCETYLHQRLRTKKHFGNGGTEFFEMSSEELRSTVEDAREFLSEYILRKKAAEELAGAESKDEVIVATDDIRRSYKRLLKIREKEDALKYEREMIEFKLKIAMGTASELKGIATWKSTHVNRFDQAAFKKIHPNLFRDFSMHKIVRIFRLTRK